MITGLELLREFLTFTAEIYAQRRVGLVGVVVLSRHKPVAVVVILVADVPINAIRYFKSGSCFGRLERHRIRADDQVVGGRHQITLARIPVDAVTREHRQARNRIDERVDEEEVVPHEVLALAQRAYVSQKQDDSRVARYPQMRVAPAQGEFWLGCPIDSRSENSTLDVNVQTVRQKICRQPRNLCDYFGRIPVVSCYDRGVQ